MSEIKVFKRKAWARNPSWPDGWEPYAGGRKTHVCYVIMLMKQEPCARKAILNANQEVIRFMSSPLIPTIRRK